MSTIIHRNNASKEKILASNVLMGLGKDKADNVEKRIRDLEESGGGGSVVVVDPILTEGTHIANIAVNGNVSKLYAPNGGGTGTVTDVLVDGVSVVNQDGEAEIPAIPSDLDNLSDVNAPSPTDGQALVYNATNQEWVPGDAGKVDDVLMNGQSIVTNKVASFKNYVELTQSQYDALPASKLTDGVLYCIKDTGIVEGDKYAPIIYSLEEREVGVWTDGKPLYQKSYIFNNYALISGQNLIDLPILRDIDVIVNSIIIMSNSAHTNFRALNGYDLASSHSNSLYYVLHKQVAESSLQYKLELFTSASWATPNIYVTLQYTKTTDVPGSGTWGTDGVPMVHYDGNEKIIGTWFGETLYQKTITFNAGSASGWTSSPHGITNFKKCKSMDVFVEDSGGTLYSVGINAVANIGAACSSTNVSIYINSAYFAGRQVIATIQYTKSS